jgi:hypothetical protein
MTYTVPSITASGTTFAQFQAGGASGHLEKLITAQVATAAPTAAATATATGGGASGGLLAAGTYYFVHTESNGFGETSASPQGVQLTVGSTNQPQFTFPALQTGNTSRNLYLGAVNGSTGGPYTLYASGITTTTYTAAALAPANSYAMTPPTVISTGLTFTDKSGNTDNYALSFIRSAKQGNLESVYKFLARVVEEFNSGQPGSFQGTLNKFRRAHIAIAMLNTLCNEMGTLIDANPGTLGRSTGGIGNTSTKRTWP